MYSDSFATYVLSMFLVAATALIPVTATAAPAASEQPDMDTTLNQEDTLTVSYADAEDWLNTLPSDQLEEQIRDYALFGLAGLLGMDVEELRNALYDQSPVRDPLFWDLASNRIGPGRSLFDGDDTLHILVPSFDPYEARTIGLELDDHRKDVGRDPDFASVYEYNIDTQDRVVRLTPARRQSTSELRDDYGYVEVRIADSDELAQFLDRTQHLSSISIVDGELVAGGWNWPGVPAGSVTPEDLAVLQRGYLKARGDRISVGQFLTGDAAERLGIEVTIPPRAVEHGEELNVFFRALSEVDSDEGFGDLLAANDQLVLEAILDPYASEELRDSRTGMRENDWLYELAEALSDEFEDSDLWGMLLYISEEPVYVPSDDVTEPGFSLDPVPLPSFEELIDTLSESHFPELRGYKAEVAEFIDVLQAETDPEAFWDFVDAHEEFILAAVLDEPSSERAKRLLEVAENARTSEEFTNAYAEYADLIFSAFEDRDRPWKTLLYHAEGKPPYQHSRYDGGLEGTEAGMTYFYTDILAKGYFYELGTGSPYGTVDGFLPKKHATVPWSHCTQEDEEGRIWFGLNEEAVGLKPDELHLGDVATRVFVLVTDPINGEREIEPSYMFGQGVWWWDQHYMEMADYEPQYHRLDQLMRWGAAISWLVGQDHPLLPTPPVENAKDDWRFEQWLKAQSDLTWEYDVPFVEIEGIETETLLRLYSEPYNVCGQSWVSSGGISNPSMYRISEIVDQLPELPEAVARAGLSDVGTTYSRNRNAGRIVTLDGVRRELEPVQLSNAGVEVKAPGRKVWSLGEVKIAVPETEDRQLNATLSSIEDQFSWDMSVHGKSIGEVTVRRDGPLAEVSWEAGPVAEAKTKLSQFQEALVDFPIQDALEIVFDRNDIHSVNSVLEYYVDMCNGGNQIDDESRLWLHISERPAGTPDEILFRLARPYVVDDTSETTIDWYYARFAVSLPDEINH